MKNFYKFMGIITIVAVIGFTLAGCGNNDDPSSPGGGNNNSGGNNSGGNDNSGGNNSGGTNSGGNNSGGTNSGGTNSGGNNSGGTNSGGNNSGGTNSGGTNSGGDNSGGNNSGGNSSGGTNSGGTNSGSGNVAVSSVSLGQSTLKMVNGETDTVYATISPDNATNKNLTWSSSSTSVATVDSTKHQISGQPGGKITAKAPGTTTITVKTSDGNKTATCEVTVIPAAPTGVTATVSGGTVTVKWNSVSGAASYKVYYVGDNYENVLDGTSNSTTYTSSGWSGSGTVSFKVTAISGQLESGYTTGATASINNGDGKPKKSNS